MEINSHLPPEFKNRLIKANKFLTVDHRNPHNDKIERIKLKQKVFVYQPETSHIPEHKIIQTYIFNIGVCKNENYIKTVDHIHIEFGMKINKLTNNFGSDQFGICWFTDGRHLDIMDIKYHYDKYMIGKYS